MALALHLEYPVSWLSAVSRFPMTRSASSADLTGSKKPLPPFGGSLLGSVPMITSPTPESVMVSAAPTGAPGAADDVGPGVAGAPAVAVCQVGPPRSKYEALAMPDSTPMSTSAVVAASAIIN